MKKKMFHKYSLTELLCEGILDEGFLQNYADNIAASVEYNKKHDHIGKYIAKLEKMRAEAVSYTHLTLPTIYSV